MIYTNASDFVYIKHNLCSRFWLQIISRFETAMFVSVQTDEGEKYLNHVTFINGTTFHTCGVVI